ncbi:phosphatase PAP2 family protein [Halalkaliarchaeum sp. AArc-GB]|uniref:phosphatase PAP2 family protein n=1 Tax=unclassified Halalkaliarchaeum TaxID=2678344 RepID=UPI00217DCA9E|nr:MULTISPECIES: phosphatase PAP2 family protein [unclassified Halalkaliarchaeum]MDR5674536.1 phosphatase PAP2 family protein [Halalkaliarchaeum sp. AArc-GB]
MPATMLPELSPLTRVIVVLLSVITAGTVVAGVTIVGPGRLRRLVRTVPRHLGEVAPYVAALAIVLVVSAFAREPLQSVSELYGLYLTGTLFAIEGEFVAWLQSHATDEATRLLSWTYVYGYAFLLVFPLVAYAALEESTQLKRLLAAYTLNYAIGLVVYTIVFAHGPRNVMPDLVTSLLYTTTPDFQHLTTQININSNVFPSLHTSLSVTVAALAYRTRDVYPSWAVVSGVLATGVVFSTMYLGIHWALDVVAGTVLALACVWIVCEYIE